MAPTQILKSSQTTLLTLPGEIRNSIAQYVLTASKGLQVLFPYPASTQGLFFLSEYRLAVERPILVEPDIAAGTHSVVEFNQLKFTCHQFYGETAGVELKYNNVTICRRWDFESSVVEQFSKLNQQVATKLHWCTGMVITLKDISPRYQQELPVLTKDQFPDTAEMVARVAHWCKANPSINVHIHQPGFRPVEQSDRWLVSFIIHSVALTEVLRGVKLVEMLPNDLRILRPLAQAVEGIRKRWVKEANLKDFTATNLRLRCQPVPFDERNIKRQIKELAVWKPGWKDLMEEKWMAQARRWMEDGI